MTRTLVFTDEPIAAVGLASALAADKDLMLARVFDDPTEIAHITETARADLLLLDLASGVTGAQIEDVRRRAPRCKIICWARSLPFEMGSHLLKLGVQGILPKTMTRHLLCSYLRRIAGGEQCIDRSLFAPAPAHSNVMISV